MKSKFRALVCEPKWLQTIVSKCNDVDQRATSVIQCVCICLVILVHSFSNTLSIGAIVIRAKLDNFSIGFYNREK